MSTERTELRPGSRVRLTIDLTWLHPSLAIGAEGVVLLAGSVRHLLVRFEGAGRQPVLASQVEAAAPRIPGRRAA